MDRYDLHTHTFFSDGELVPAELANRAEELGHAAVGITDHVDHSNLDWVLERTIDAAENLNPNMEIDIIPGVELTHVPLSTIPTLARRAKNNGAKIVVVHGETITDPVPPGTNLAGLNCKEVDILAHPGVLSVEEARQAKKAGIYLELTSRKGHSLTNGIIAKLAVEEGAKLLVNTDAHSPDDLITYKEAEAIAIGAGLEEEMLEEVLIENPRTLLEETK